MNIFTIVFSVVYLAALCFLTYRSIKQYGVDALAAVVALVCGAVFIVFGNTSGLDFAKPESLCGVAILVLSIFYAVSYLRSRKKSKK